MASMMMRLFGKRSCADVAAVLDGYCEGSLDPKLARVIERHLETCTSCAALAHTYRQVVELTGELPADEVPPTVRRRIHNALRERARRKPADRG
jgi:anti-sigma factor RsiW